MIKIILTKIQIEWLRKTLKAHADYVYPNIKDITFCEQILGRLPKESSHIKAYDKMKEITISEKAYKRLEEIRKTTSKAFDIKLLTHNEIIEWLLEKDDKL